MLRRMSDPTPDETVWFGDRPVEASRKAPLVRRVFDSVAGRYDLMNDLMSLGVHRLWKAAMVGQLSPRPGMVLLDVAGGTGDIAFRFLERARARAAAVPAPRGATAVVCDINPAMLAVGRRRAAERGFGDGVAWACGDAERLPIRSASADACTIAFGLRNVTRIDAALAEMRRVLRPGGRFLCLEFSHVAVPLLAEAYDAYSYRVLPALGEIVTGDRDAYQYLVESIRRFPRQEDLAARMREAGFDRVRFRNFSGGIVALHSGWRL